jgi:hypothetical protein
MRIARPRKVFIPLGSSRLRCRRTELDDSSPFQWRKPLQSFREPDRNIKLNHFCHSSALPLVCFHHVDRVQRPCHSHPHWHRTESLNLSFLRSASHIAHDLIHMFLLYKLDSLITFRDARLLSSDCQTNAPISVLRPPLLSSLRP